MAFIFENDVLSTTLPSGWLDSSDGEIIAFANPRTNEELIVSTGNITQRVDEAKLAALLWKLMEQKVSVLSVASDGTFKVLNAIEPKPATCSFGMVSGFDTKYGVHTKTTISGNLCHFESISYYRRGCLSISDIFEAEADEIISQVKFKSQETLLQSKSAWWKFW